MKQFVFLVDDNYERLLVLFFKGEIEHLMVLAVLNYKHFICNALLSVLERNNITWVFSSFLT